MMKLQLFFHNSLFRLGVTPKQNKIDTFLKERDKENNLVANNFS